MSLYSGVSHIFEYSCAEFLQPSRRESRRLCGELAWMGQRKPPPKGAADPTSLVAEAQAGRPLARASDGFLARILQNRMAGPHPVPRFKLPLAGFSPPPGSKNSIAPESDSARGRGLPGLTTEVSLPQTGLVSPSARRLSGSAAPFGGKAGATERRKALEKFCQFTFRKVGISR